MNHCNTARTSTRAAALGLTALFVLVLIITYFRYDRSRTLFRALQKVEGDPVCFSEDSGFFEEGFILHLAGASGIPEDIEICYTTDGSDPTQTGSLYEGGIDLAAAAAQSLSEREKTGDPAALSAEEESTGEEISASAGTSGTSEGDKSAGAQAAEGETSAGDSTARPSVEDGYAAWKEEKNALVSEKGTAAEPAEDGICVIPVRASLVQGEDCSSIVTRTYVIGEGVRNRYSAYVISIATDPAGLFDYDSGIMVQGSRYQEDIDKGLRRDRSGNFYHNGEDWIRNGHVTIFSPDGSPVLEEDGGLAVAGYSSRILPTRSLRLEASAARGSTDDWFYLPVFSCGTYSPGRSLAADTKVSLQNRGEADAAAPLPNRGGAGSSAEADEPAAKDNDPAAEAGISAEDLAAAGDDRQDYYRRIRFRTHGAPQIHVRSVRGEFAKILTDECGFPGLPEYRLGVCYLNGEFYTLCDLAPSMTNEYLCGIFGLSVPEALEKYEGNDYTIFQKSRLLPLLNADLTQEENCARLEEEVDIDNYLFYYALEVALNNADWPFNNVVMWRYLGKKNPENPYTDGRFRFVLDDMDQILTNGLHSKPENWSTEVFDYLMKDEKSTFHRTMQCTKYRDIFLTYVDDLLRTSFQPAHACAILDRLYAEMKDEYVLDYGEAFWEEMEETAEITEQNVREKEALFRADVDRYLGLTDRCTVQIEAGEGISVTWNSMANTGLKSGEKLTASYYCGTSITYTARPEDGWRLAGWELNGKIVEAADDPAAAATAASLEDGSGTCTLRIPDSGSPVILRAIAEPVR